MGDAVTACRPPVLGCNPNVKFSRKAGKIGLRNVGNSCFMNAGLQCLCHVEPFAAYFLNGAFKDDINETSLISSHGDIARAFADVVRSLWQSEQNTHNPLELRKNLAKFAPHLFEGCEQQDVQEFLAFCIDGLHEDLNRVVTKPPPISDAEQLAFEKLGRQEGEEFSAALAWLRHLEHGKSFLVDLLQGQLRSSLTCKQCGHSSRRFDPFLYLSVPVTKTMSSVTDAINHFLAEELLTGVDQWYCEECKTKVDASKKIDIWKLPPVLVLHLKRFEFDAKTMHFEKTENRLSMKLSALDLAEFCSSPQRDGSVYNVVCVANHSGAYGSGHYTATCRVGGLDRGTWHHFNDSVVTCVDGRNVVSRETYVIFLMRDQDPGEISKSLRSKKRTRPVLLRRQSLSQPGNWPHPEPLVSAVLNAAGRGPRDSESGNCSESSSSCACEVSRVVQHVDLEHASAPNMNTLEGARVRNSVEALNGDADAVQRLADHVSTDNDDVEEVQTGADAAGSFSDAANDRLESDPAASPQVAGQMAQDLESGEKSPKPNPPKRRKTLLDFFISSNTHEK